MKLSGWSVAAVVVLLGALFLRFGPFQGAKPNPDPTGVSASPTPAQLTPDKLLTRIHAGNKRMLLAGERFGDSVLAAINQAPSKDNEVSRSHGEAIETIRTVRDEFETYLPPDSQSGRRLFFAYRQYVAWQEKIYREDYADIVEHFQRPDVSPLERQNLVRTIFAERSQEEKMKSHELVRFRDALRAEHALDR